MQRYTMRVTDEWQPLGVGGVQVRGSIPLYWTQEGSKLKPDILLQQYDPLYGATRKHFRDLRQRYGGPLVVLNLVKSAEKRPRETILRRELHSAINYLNQNVRAHTGPCSPPPCASSNVCWEIAALLLARHCVKLQSQFVPICNHTVQDAPHFGVQDS